MVTKEVVEEKAPEVRTTEPAAVLRVYVKNNSNTTITETKPEVGTFIFPPGVEVQMYDVVATKDVIVPTQYIKYTAKELAYYIVQDYQPPDTLTVIIR